MCVVCGKTCVADTQQKRICPDLLPPWCPRCHRSQELMGKYQESNGYCINCNAIERKRLPEDLFTKIRENMKKT